MSKIKHWYELTDTDVGRLVREMEKHIRKNELDTRFNKSFNDAWDAVSPTYISEEALWAEIDSAAYKLFCGHVDKLVYKKFGLKA